MKKITYLFMASVATVALVGCGNRAKSSETFELDEIVVANPMAVKTNAVVDTAITLNGSTADYVEISRIFPVDKEGQFFLSVRAVVPESNSPVTDSLYKAIASYYDMITCGEGEASAVSPINSVELARAIDDMGAAFKTVAEPLVADSTVYGYQMTAVVEPVYHTAGLTTYLVYEDSYTGGAHGDVNTYFVSFNPEDGGQYSFDTLVKGDRLKDVRKKLVESIAAQKEMSVNDYLASVAEFMGMEKLTVETFPIYNVGITADGLVFAYPKYSIAPGFEGCPMYAISLDEISDDLTL